MSAWLLPVRGVRQGTRTFRQSASLVLGRGRRRWNNKARQSAPESDCLEYLRRQFLLRGCEVLSKKAERIRATDIAKIYARNPVARSSRTCYLCAKTTDGLFGDNVGRFPSLFERA